jgi:hypothetical protein
VKATYSQQQMIAPHFLSSLLESTRYYKLTALGLSKTARFSLRVSCSVTKEPVAICRHRSFYQN